MKRAIGILSGEDRSILAGAARVLLRAGEPVYAGAMRLRNAAYGRGWMRSHDLGRPTISVGNITTGGTGKTPMVLWLCAQLLKRGHRPAVLMRGYRAGREGSDEQRMLGEALGANVAVVANPDRVAGAKEALRRSPEATCFVLDDGFQHRRARRAFDLVLVSATSPFGHGHVLPRGLLREPLEGLSRADAIVLTRCDRISSPQRLEELAAECGRYAPVYKAEHRHLGLMTAEEDVSLARLSSTRFFVFTGIGEPKALLDQLGIHRGMVGSMSFADHHDYTAEDVRLLEQAGRASGAEALVTTEKDWVKVAGMAFGMPVWRVAMDVVFRGEDGERLLDRVLKSLHP